MTAAFQSLLKLMENRRSIRRFQQRPVPRQVVEMLMEAARWAPSAGNRQNFRFLAVVRVAIIEALADAVREQISRVRQLVREDYGEPVAQYAGNFLHFSRAPLLIVPIHRQGPNLLNALCNQEVVPEKDTCPESCCSVSAAIMNLLLAAHALGLGTCWMSGPLIAQKSMTKILEVPPGWAISALIPTGYPDESPPAPGRRPVSQLLRHLDDASWEKKMPRP
jgi:nitroreductase